MKKIILLFLLSILISCSKKVEKINVKLGNITESIYASGVVKSENQYQVFPKTNGILQTLFVEEGDLVSKQQILFSIYNETSSLSRENAQLLAQFNDFDNNSDKLKDLKMNIEFAKNKMLNDSTNYERQKNLMKQNVISKTQFEQTELMFENSRTAYNSAKIRYSDLKKQLSFSDQQSKRNLQISQNLEGDFLIKSEVKGKVYAILKEKGEMVSVQTPVAIVGDADNFLLELQIDENDIVQVKKGQKIVVTLDSYKGKTFEALVTKINPYLNEKSKTFKIEAKFVEKPEKLYPNLSLEANIIVQTKNNVLLVPREFILDETYVMKEGGKKVKVKIGLKDFEQVEILSGVSKGEVLILESK